MTVDDQQLEALQDDAQVILPIYIAVDRSYSMGENGAIDSANQLVPAIMDTCAKNPIADDRARFSVIGFNERAELVAPLARGTNLAPHTFTASGGTNFTSVFELLREQIESDHATLRADGYRSFRPAVFLITDGEPTCNAAARQAAFEALVGPSSKLRPNLSVFGVGSGVSEKTVVPYTANRGRAFLTGTGAGAAESLSEFIGILMSSVMSSTDNAATSSPEDKSGFEWDDDALADAEFLHGLES